MLMATVDSLTAPAAAVRDPPVAQAAATQPQAQPDAPAVVADPLAAMTKPPSPEMLKQAVASANDALRTMTQAVEFEYDDDAHVTIIKLIDTADQKVLRQVPSVEMLQIAKALERMQSTLVHEQA
jgi:flagellar protein FlaG